MLLEEMDSYRYSTSFLPVRVIERQVVHCSRAKELVDALGQVFHINICQHMTLC